MMVMVGVVFKIFTSVLMLLDSGYILRRLMAIGEPQSSRRLQPADVEIIAALQCRLQVDRQLPWVDGAVT
jgi:hypothetical protein